MWNNVDDGHASCAPMMTDTLAADGTRIKAPRRECRQRAKALADALGMSKQSCEQALKLKDGDQDAATTYLV